MISSPIKLSDETKSILIKEIAQLNKQLKEFEDCATEFDIDFKTEQLFLAIKSYKLALEHLIYWSMK